MLLLSNFYELFLAFNSASIVVYDSMNYYSWVPTPKLYAWIPKSVFSIRSFILLSDYKNYEVLEKSYEKTSSNVDSVYFD